MYNNIDKDFTLYCKCSLTRNKRGNIPKKSGIYCFRNNINGKCYIGQAINIRTRITQHLWALKKNKLPYLIYKAFNKYGISNFSLYIIEEDVSRDSLNDREVYWIKHFNSLAPNGYNLTTGGGQAFEISEETREKFRQKNCKKVIAYNYKCGYYLECKSRKQMSRILKEMGFNITRWNIGDSIRHRSYSGDFVFAESVPGIWEIIKNKKLPASITIYLYNTETSEYSPEFKSCVDATDYIKQTGVKIGDSHIRVALTNKNTKVKQFLIAKSVEELENLVKNYRQHKFIFCYNSYTGKMTKYISKTDASKQTGCCLADVCKCVSGKQLSSKGYSFGYTQIDCLERITKKLETTILEGYNVLKKRKVFNNNYRELIMKTKYLD